MALGLAAASISVFAVPAHAHDPIILTAAQTTPARGPLLLDGTVSFAVYGTVDAPGATRGFRVRFAAGDRFSISALVPDQAPESAYRVDEMPKVGVVTPSGETVDLEPGAITTFAEPFTKTDYRRYLEWSTVAEAGDYGVTVTGVVPARFTVSVGTKEQFGTPVEDVPNRAEGVGGVLAWYRTPPPTVTTVPSPSGSESPTAGGPAESAERVGNPAVMPLLVGAGIVAAIAAAVAVRFRRGSRTRS